MSVRTTRLALTGLVAGSFLARLFAAFFRPTPDLFPDEYVYAELGRSFAATGQPLVRHSASHFPGLLEPLLTAPAWLIGDVGTAYRFVQGFGSLTMSLAAIPAFLIARRLGLGRGLSLGVAALAVAAPDLVFASFISSEAIAYPLLLAAVAAALVALTKPTRRSQLAFVAFTGLTALARIQLAVLPVVFLLACVLVGLRERRVKKALREQLLPLLLFAVPLTVLAAVPSLLGPYGGGAGAVHLRPLGLLRWMVLDLMSLAYSSGWIIVPGALVGIWLAYARPRSREETAFAALTLPLAGALLLPAGMIQSGLLSTDGIQERYVFYLIPLVGTAFALYARRGWPHRLVHLLLAAGLLVLTVRVPLSSFTALGGASGSPLLFAVSWLSLKAGQAGTGSLVVASVAGLLSVGAIACSRRPRLGTPLALGLAICALGAASAGAVAYDARSTTGARDTFLPQDKSWIDRFHLGHVALLQGFAGLKTDALEQLFWNRSVDRVLLLPGAGRFDAFAYGRVHIGPDGSLLVGGKAVREPLLVDGYAATIRLRGARPLAKHGSHVLWQPTGTPQISLYAVGHYHDNWLSDAGAFYLWPPMPGGGLSGWLKLTVTAPRLTGSITFKGPHGEQGVLQLDSGESRWVRMRVCGRGPWYATFHASPSLRSLLGLRLVTVHATAPTFQRDPHACTAGLSQPNPSFLS